METETNAAGVDLQENPHVGVYYLRINVINPVTIPLTSEELRTVVQQAYDRFGILAKPSIDVEAARAEPLLPEPYRSQIHAGLDKIAAGEA